MVDLLAVVVAAGLASHRLTRLVTRDRLLVRQRTWLLGRYPPKPWADDTGTHRASKLGILLSCPHCAGFWITGLVAVAALAAGRIPGRDLLAVWLAAAGLQSILGQHDEGWAELTGTLDGLLEESSRRPFGPIVAGPRSG